jgi:L-threonylcarbamoyladenylate synthase
VPEALADAVLDGGCTQVGIESTVLSLVDEPVLLRPGVIPLHEIEALIGPVRIAGETADGPHPSPGQHPTHYAPRTPLFLLRRGEPAPPGHGIWMRLGEEMPVEPRAYAAALYAALHRADERSPDWIAVEPPPNTPEWAGVLDRLRRASHK